MFAFIGLTFIAAAVCVFLIIGAIVRAIRGTRSGGWNRRERQAVKELLELSTELAAQLVELVRSHDRLETRVGILERYISHPDAPRPFRDAIPQPPASAVPALEGREPAGPSADEAARSATVPVYSDGPEEIPAIRPVEPADEAADMGTLDGLGTLSPELEELAHIGEPPDAA